MALSLGDLGKKIREETSGGGTIFHVLVELLGSKERRTIAHNTDLDRMSDGHIGVILHWTRILEFTPDNTVILRSGGWHSVTTHARINMFAPSGNVTFKVYNKKYAPRVATMRLNPEHHDYNQPYWLRVDDQPFTEGMVIDLNTGEIRAA